MMSSSLSSAKDQEYALNSITESIVNEYHAYERDISSLEHFLNYEKINNQLMTKGQDMQNFENYIMQQKAIVENKIYNYVKIFSECCQSARGFYNQTLDEQLAIYRNNIQTLQQQIAYEYNPLLNENIPNCSTSERVRDLLGGDYSKGQNFLEQIFNAKRKIEKAKRIAWVNFKIADKLLKINSGKINFADGKTWKESENDLRNYMESFFQNLRLKEIKPYYFYQNNIADHFQITLPNYFQIPNPFLHFFESGSNNLYRIEIKSLRDDIIDNIDLAKILIDSEIKIPDWHASVATPQGQIYLVGGTDFKNSSISSPRTYVYREDINSFVRKSNMNIPREAFSLIYIEEKLYAIGGISAGRGVLAECEVYDIKRDQWRQIENMNGKCCQAAICNLKNKYIFKFGGLEDKLKEGAVYCPNIEKYSIMENKWTVLKPKIKDFILSAAVSLNPNQLFIFGGVTSNYDKINDSFIMNYDQEFDQGQWLPSERIISINQKPLPTKEGFWNNYVIIHDKNFYCLQNVRLSDIFYGSAINKRRILRFGAEQWKIFN